MERALARHRAGEARVIPILVKDCDWRAGPFGALRPLPSNGRPVASWPDQSEAWAEVARLLRAAVADLRAATTAQPRDIIHDESGSRDLAVELRPEPVDALIMTALQDELDAVLRLGDGGREGWRKARDRSGFPYFFRQMRSRRGGPLLFAAAWSGEMGRTAAAARATALIDELDPGCLAMCGICAGKRGDVSLGDVIVADRVYSFDHGKLIARGKGRRTDFYHDIETYQLEKVWKMDAALFARDLGWSATLVKQRPISKQAQMQWFLNALHDHEQDRGPHPHEHPERKARCPDWASKKLLAALRTASLIDSSQGTLRLTDKGRAQVLDDRLHHPDGLPGEPPFRVHIGPIATGEAVQEDPALFDRLKRLIRKTLGIEMEAAAIGYVGERLGRRSIIAKAVSDYADSEKDDGFRDFACRASTEFLAAFLQEHLEPRATLAPTVTPSSLEARSAPSLHFRSPGAGIPARGAATRAASKQAEVGRWERLQKDRFPDVAVEETEIVTVTLDDTQGAVAPESAVSADRQAQGEGCDLAGLLAKVEEALQRAPALAAALVRKGYGNPGAGDLARDVAGALVKVAANQVATDLAELAGTPDHRGAARNLLWLILPLAGDWDSILEQAGAASPERDVLELRLRTETIAEVVLARIEGRRCSFAPGGDFPSGAAQ